MAALAMVVMGVVINRWNITLSGLVAPPEWSPGVLGNVVAVSYFPSWIEIGVAIGIVSYALLGFTLGARYLAIYRPAGGAAPHTSTPVREPTSPVE